ncbi:MAG: hypothetical protein P4L46_23090 [Fimbriimonas sp.]|nr:hypothetical protein [Fimbriimonas sp.]
MKHQERRPCGQGALATRLDTSELADAVPGWHLQCCGTCAKGLLPRYGGADERHVIYCCRNDLATGKIKWEDGEIEGWDECLTGVSCFHWCDQYESRASAC